MRKKSLPVKPKVPSSARVTSAVSPSHQVVRYVRDLHQQGVVHAGEPIPSERALSRELGVHRVTVRRAMTLLTEEGFLRVRENGERIIRREVPLEQHALSDTFVVLMPDLVGNILHPGHFQPGWPEMIGQSVVQSLREAGRRLLIPSKDVDDEFLAQLRAVPPAGLIVTDSFGEATELDRISRAAQNFDFPVVAYGDHPRWAHVDRVVSDHFDGARLLADFLRERGCKKILLVMPIPNEETEFWVSERIRGYKRSAVDSGASYRQILEIPPLPGYGPSVEVIDAQTRFCIGYLSEFLLGPRCADAIMVASDGMIPVVCAACRKLGRTPGEDIEIVGYDNYWKDLLEWRDEPYRPLATVDKLNFEVGQALVTLLLERLDGKLPQTPVIRRITPRLMITPRPAAR